MRMTILEFRVSGRIGVGRLAPLLAAFSMLPGLVAGQVPELRTTLEYRRSADSSVVCMSPQSDGGAYLVAADGTVTRVDADRKVLFTKPSLVSPLTAARCYTEVTPAGDWVLGFFSAGLTVAMLKPDGTLKFSKKLAGTWSEVKFAANSRGGVLVGGNVEKDFYHDIQVMEIDGSGLTEWSAFVHWASDNLLHGLAAGEGGGYVLTGTSGVPQGAGFSWIYRIDEYGDSTWRVETGKATGEMLSAVAKTREGGYLLGGTIPRLGFDNLDFWILETDASGRRINQHIFGDRKADRILDIHQLPGGDILMAGTTRPYLGSMEGNIYHSGPYLQATLKLLAPSGETRWSVASLDTVDVNQVSCLSPAPGAFWMGIHSGYYWTMGKSLRYSSEGSGLLSRPSGRRKTPLLFTDNGFAGVDGPVFDLTGRLRASRAGFGAGMRILLPTKEAE